MRQYEPAWTHRSGLDVLSGGAYRGGLRRAILRLKDSNDLQVARLLSAWLSRIIQPYATGIQGIVAVPTARRRRRWRGYCAPERLACQLARQLQLRLETPLGCPGDPAPRKQLRGFAQRRAAGAKFEALQPVRGSFILVDDVVTSGQTLAEARSALLQAGATSVLPVVLARSVTEPGRTAARRR